MKTPTQHLTHTVLALCFIAFCASALETWHAGFGWHDQQRVYQLVLLCVAAPLAILLPQQALPHRAQLMLLTIFGLGLASTLLSAWPEWAFKEWARYLGLTLLVVLLGATAREKRVRHFVLWAMAGIGVVHAFQFLVYYLAAFLSGIRMLDADLLFNGFSNPRFFAQFQIMLMPVLAFLALHCWQDGQRKRCFLIVATLGVQWCIALTLGGRGLWLGLAVSHSALLIVSLNFWRLIVLQVIAGLLGFILFAVLFYVIPGWLDLAPTLRDSLRTSLSGREKIWQLAWEMAIANPWLGAGPMHYSAAYNPIAAHPHQVILQWLAEWGFLATSLAVILGAWGIVHGILFLRRTTASNLDAALWLAIVGALVLAQVDGVFVMPYTETWLAILIGLALARWAAPLNAKPTQKIGALFFAIPVVFILGQVLIKEVPALAQNSEAHMAKQHTGYTPRFWLQGWIPMDGKESEK